MGIGWNTYLRILSESNKIYLLVFLIRMKAFQKLIAIVALRGIFNAKSYFV